MIKLERTRLERDMGIQPYEIAEIYMDRGETQVEVDSILYTITYERPDRLGPGHHVAMASADGETAQVGFNYDPAAGYTEALIEAHDTLKELLKFQNFEDPPMAMSDRLKRLS